ncbi:ABC transporter permease subunit [Sulfitobacter sp. D35]|uniref:ABC transporter permease n=1 Tax=Sulfitobacter sp. D35 TaxID=3083252 RepID=UPI00296F20CD|nr:ABC transporter permease subunit [Sulfitobacter sp. D35]MDW4497932.1 ABC transporter permease subunit [Sulfitobacter sp. D35]
MTALDAPRPATAPGRRSPPLVTIAVLALVAGWELSARTLGAAFVIVGPVEVATYLSQNAGLMMRALSATAQSAAWGFVIGNLAALLLAATAILVPRSETLVSALALLVFCLPLVATGPILRVLFGPGTGPQITLAGLAVYYTTFVPLMVGVRAAPATWFDLVRTYGGGRLSALVHVRARAALPYFFAGLQIAAPAAFLGAMVGEFTGAERGLGVLTIRAMRALDVDAIWAIATLSAAAAILAYLAIGWLAEAVTRAPPPVILTPPRSAPPTGTSGRIAGAVLRWSVVAVTVLAAWWGLMTAFDLSPFFAKRPGDVFGALFLDTDAAGTRQTLTTALGETLVFVLPGYLAGLAAGAGLAIAVSLNRLAALVTMPLAITLRSVPIVTTAPLVIVLLGRGAAGTIALVALMVFFPTLVACLYGLKQAPGQILDVMRSYGAGRGRQLLHARVPAMLPAFFAAARMAVPASILATTVVEWLATGRGIGSLMALSASLSDYDMLWSCVVVVALLTVLLHGLVARLERAVAARFASEQLAR